MPFTTIAWAQSIDPGGVFTALATVADQTIALSGTTAYLVPGTYNNLAYAAAGVETTVAQQARLTSPSIRQRGLFRITPTQGNAAAASLPADPHRVSDVRVENIPLVTGEVLRAEILSDPAAAQIQWVVLGLADGPLAQVAGPQFTVRATGATALIASTWVTVPIVFVDDLPRGRYQLVGLRAQSTNLVAARVVFVGPQAATRPGCLGTNNDRHLEHPMFRYGGLGVWGEFEDVEPPAIECLANAADAAEIFYLDLIQIRAGPG